MTIKTKEKIVNMQLQMIGVEYDIRAIGRSPTVKIGGKDKLWWQVYKFENIQQYQEWREKALTFLEEEQVENPRAELDDLDFKFGLLYKYEKGP